MRYLRVTAGPHELLIEAASVAQVDADGHETRLVGVEGGAMRVDVVHGLVDLDDEALAPAPWLPDAAAALVDAVVLAPVGGVWPWRLHPAALHALLAGDIRIDRP